MKNNRGLYERFVYEALTAWRNEDMLKAGHVDSFIVNYAIEKDKRFKNTQQRLEKCREE